MSKTPVRLRLWPVWIVAVLWAFRPAPGAAQVALDEVRVGQISQLGLFLDCNARGCDEDFFRQEIGFVNWVRDPADAQVYVLITSQDTGGGGQAYTFGFLGRGAFEGEELELEYASGATATEDEIRRGIARTLRLGLAPYAARTAIATQLDLVYDGAGETGEAAVPVLPQDDPWNLWVFEFGVDGSIEGESLTKEMSFGGNFSADRVTPLWKHGIFIRGNYRQETFTFEEDGVLETFRDIRRSFRFETTNVRSVAPRWSVGFQSGASSSTSDNRDLEVFGGPAIEYSFFPYEEFTRRQLVLQYVVSGNYLDYTDETIYGQTEEMLYRQSLGLGFAATQPWGEAGLTLEGSHYLHDLSKYNVRLGGDLEFRLVRGVSLELDGNVAWVRDQLALPREGASVEDVLLQRRELETNYEYRLSLGLNYQFGSPFNNIVNPRLDELGDDFDGRDFDRGR